VITISTQWPSASGHWPRHGGTGKHETFPGSGTAILAARAERARDWKVSPLSNSAKNACKTLAILSVLSGLALGSSRTWARPGIAPNSASITVTTDAKGVKRFSLDGAPFVPIGVNYLVNSQAKTDGKIYKTFDMFNTRNFAAQAIDADFKSMAENGFNFVRIWLKGGDTDAGFASASSENVDSSRWNAYVKNVAFTLQTARKYGLHVVLTGSFPGPSQNMFVPRNYLPGPGSVPGTETVQGLNRLILIPQMAQSLGRFYYDLLTALKGIDPQAASTIFYADIYNELHFELDKRPFSGVEGRFNFNGRKYNLEDFSANDQLDPSSRQALMDDSAEYFFKTVKSYIDRAMPKTLITASTGFNYISGHDGFDGGQNTRKKPNNYMLRPYYELRGGADLIDIHIYPSPALPQFHLPPFAERALEIAATDEVFPLNDNPSAPAITARKAPLIVGEYGAEIAKYDVKAPQQSAEFAEEYREDLPDAVHELKVSIRQALCPLGFSGYAVWDWRSEKPCCFSLNSPDDPRFSVMRALAPRYSPSYCGQRVEPVSESQ